MKACIKYFGGKGVMSKKILEFFPDKKTYDIFIDAFGGSGAILLAKEPGGVEIYNDLDSNVFALYTVLTNANMFEVFKSQCDLLIYSEELRNYFKRELRESTLSIQDRAFKFYAVNRMSHNGIGGFSINTYIRRGMSKSTSDFLSSVDRLKDMHDRLSRVIVTNKDALELIEKYDRDKTFIYCDSPYHHDTRTDFRYPIDMTNVQQSLYIDTLLKVQNAKVLVSGYNCQEYERLCEGGWQRVDFDVNTIDGARKSKVKTESVWYNYDL